MKKPLGIAILSYVGAQPPENFPIQEFTIQDSDATPEEVLAEIALLNGAGLLSAAILRDNKGRPLQVAIRSITLQGRDHLESWIDNRKKQNPIHKVWVWMIALIGVLLASMLTESGKHLFVILQEKVFKP
jgi:hypothetical protein